MIRAKGLAEAEAKEKLAEAFEKFGEAAVLDILAKMLPELAGRIAGPIGNVERLAVVDTGNGAGAGRVANYVTELMATAPEMLKQVSGIDMNALAQRLSGARPRGAARSRRRREPAGHASPRPNPCPATRHNAPAPTRSFRVP